MWIKPLRGTVGEYGQLRRNVPANLRKEVAERLIGRGLAVAVTADGKAKPKGNASKATPKSGGRTGRAKRPSSSEADRAPAPSGSSTGGDAPGS